jgi:O-methyltransferase involved in polyketide biosynthesis
MAAADADQIAPSLAGVSETLLWALHNRALEASRRDGVLVDPYCLRIHNAIDYDFGWHFGVPVGSLASRAAEIDRILMRWIAHHPDGLVVSLGEGLETQRQRVDNGRVRWLSVDLPAAISLRERFLPPTERFRHFAANALDPGWMDAADPASGIIIVAQGLLMYLDPAALQEFFVAISRRFPGAEMVFDVVPRWFSRLTMLGLHQTLHYRLPPMPWGINRDEIEPTLRRWIPNLDSVALLDYRVPRGLPFMLAQAVGCIPFVRHEVPTLVHLVVAQKPISSNIVPFRKKQMTTIDGVLEAATRNANSSNDLAIAAGEVIAKRVALGVAAVFNPLQADHAELGRMVPEKMEAFSAAGRIMLQKSGQAGEQFTRLASDTIAAATRATVALAGCTNPVAMAHAQSSLAVAWFEQMTSNFMKMGILALGAHEAAMVPIRQTIAANAKRLGR